LEDAVIPEPQKTYVLELLKALGPAAGDFVIVGAQAMKFMLAKARATKDIDFVLDVVRLRAEPRSLAATLAGLGYTVVEESQNFQFEKPIPGSQEVMRIEFMAPEEFKRKKDFRVDVEKDVHARFCTGGSIALAESSLHTISGKLPDGSLFSASVRVTQPHALVMLKLLALDDRYQNIRGPEQAKHDREEARTHAADVVHVISGQAGIEQFKENFENQFRQEPTLGVRVLKILHTYFRDDTSPGLLLYEEVIAADQPLDRAARQQVRQEAKRAHQMMLKVFPPKEFYALLGAVEDCCDLRRNPPLVEGFLTNLKQTGTKITDAVALERLPGEAFGGAYRKGDTFLTNASEALKSLPSIEASLISSHLQTHAAPLRRDPYLAERFGPTLA
jgi:hypothetical protein